MHKTSQQLFNDTILVEALRRFGLEKRHITPLDGFESFVFAVKETPHKEFILRITHSLHRTENEIRAEIEWINYLVAGGVPAATTLPSLKGDMVEVIALEESCFMAVLFEKLPGHHPGSDEKDGSTYELLGEILGRMHRLTKGFYFSDAALSRRDWECEITEVSAHLPASDTVILDTLQELLLKLSTLPQNRESYGLIHTDAHWGNLFLHEGGIQIFDFDDSAYMWFINDIAIVLFYGLMDRYKDYSEEQHIQMILSNLLKGYRKENQISREWIERIPLFLKLREIDLYMVIHRSCDVENLEDPWCKSYMQGRRERIAQRIPYVSFDFTTFVEEEKPFSSEEYIERAVNWAVERVGISEYAFYSLAFVEDAYERSNSIEMFGGDDATGSADFYGVTSEGVPPRGAFVFYHANGDINGEEKDWGHVGISLGDGSVIHSWGAVRIDEYRAIEDLQSTPELHTPIYRGWVTPEVLLKGAVYKEYEESPSYPNVNQ